MSIFILISKTEFFEPFLANRVTDWVLLLLLHLFTEDPSDFYLLGWLVGGLFIWMSVCLGR